MTTFQQALTELSSGRPRFTVVVEEFHYDAGLHPSSYIDRECEFAARHLGSCVGSTILDVGSYRLFVLGLLAHRKVITLDVRPRGVKLGNETALTCEAKSLSLPSQSVDAVVSLCAIEHFGLGRYGDEIDFEADVRAVGEIKRVLRPGGMLVLSTTITNGPPTLVFNAHRIYNYESIVELFRGLDLVDEQFVSMRNQGLCLRSEVTGARGDWDVYLGCWKMP